MNIKIIKVVVFFASFGIFGCQDKYNHYFNGEIRYFDSESVNTKNVESKSISLNGVYTGMIAVYDSLLFCWSPTFSDHFFNVFNVDTGEQIGQFVSKGRGPQEAISVNCIMQFFKNGDDLMTLLHATNEGRLFVWNISKSVEEGTTVYDSIIPYENGSIFFEFYQSEDVMFAYKSSEPNGNEVSTPFYQKRTINTNELIKNYPIYKMASVKNNNNDKIPRDLFFYTWDVIKPDGSKIVQVMKYLPQLNIIDTRTGNVSGYQMKNGPNFSLLGTDLGSVNKYYNCVSADDNYIYATYWGKEPWIDRFGVPLPDFNTIHVFDWNGKLCDKFVTDRSFFRAWLDPVRNRLYTINMNTDEIYYLEIDKS